MKSQKKHAAGPIFVLPSFTALPVPTQKGSLSRAFLPSILHTILLSCLRFFLEAFDAAADGTQAVEHFGSFAFLIRLSCGDRSLHFLAVDASRKEDCVALPDRFVICYVKTGTILRFYAKDIPAPSSRRPLKSQSGYGRASVSLMRRLSSMSPASYSS